MATSLGIHLQSHGFDYVLLDGSAKRYSVKKSGSSCPCCTCLKWWLTSSCVFVYQLTASGCNT